MANEQDHGHDLSEMLANNIASAVTRHTSSQEFRSELIGEIMTHCGHTLLLGAANYIVIRPEDVIVKPEPIGKEGDALLLTKTVQRTSTSYSVIVNVTKRVSLEPPAKGDEFVYACTIFVPNELNTMLTKFVKLPPAHQIELERQLAIICRSVGTVMLNLSVVPGHFKKLEAEEAAKAAHAAHTHQSVEELRAAGEANKATALQQATAHSGLPEPDADLL